MKSVRTRLRESIIYNLKKITKEHGYNVSIGEVFSNPKAIDAINIRPAVSVKFGEHECLNANDGTLTQGFELHYKVLVTLVIYLENNNDIELEREEIVADIQRLFMNNPQIPDEFGNGTCFECMFQNDYPYGTEETKPFGGHLIQLICYYRQNMKDPTKIC